MLHPEVLTNPGFVLNCIFLAVIFWYVVRRDYRSRLNRRLERRKGKVVRVTKWYKKRAKGVASPKLP